MNKRKNIEQDIEREMGEDVRRILEGEDLRDISEEAGPRLYPGMEDAGIGSTTRIYNNELPDEKLPDDDLLDDDLPDDGYGELPEGTLDEGFFDADDDLTDEEDEEEEYPRRPRKRRRGPYLFIACAFGLLFLLLSAHLVYFNLRMKDEILSSPYNRRQNAQADLVRRGKIVSIDGATLARTDTWDDGTEERVYPYANIFAHAVGFVTHGKSGIESAANYELLTSHINIIDQIINEFLKKKSEGDTVVTTLNAGLQETAYYALGDYRGAVLVMNPKTGAILAMVSKPNFDPNTLADIWDEMVSDPTNSNLVNRALQGLYPPGSTFKIATSLAYYRQNRSFDNFFYNCTGEFTIDDYTVHCYKGTVHGEEDFSGAFAHSCNTAFSQIGLMLGNARLTDVAKSLMFGESLPTELIASKSRWSLDRSSDEIELVQTAFGQGKTLVTPYHMALIVSAIANGGTLMTPRLIDHIESASGEIVSKTKPVKYKDLLSAKEAEALTELMVKVVTQGSASALSEMGFRVAGKTGSAEYAKSDGTIGTHSWFVGFNNPDDPDLVIAVLAEDGGAGSSTAVPIAARILEAYYGY